MDSYQDKRSVRDIYLKTLLYVN